MRNLILVIVIVVVAAYIFLVIKKNREAAAPRYVEQEVTLSPKQTEPQSAPQPPPVKYPVAPVVQQAEQEPEQVPAPAPPPEPLPALDQSDAALLSGLVSLAPDIHWRDLFQPGNLVRRIVVTADNMTAEKLPQKFRVTQRLPGSFQIQKTGEQGLIIADDNYQRYAAYVSLLESVDLNRLVTLYRRFYPLFQQAYGELGYPGRYFNDRLVEVIDHLLATPEIQGPIQLKQPNVFYVFADPKLEALSAGQKVLLRIGPHNAARVKARLSELRTLLTGNN